MKTKLILLLTAIAISISSFSQYKNLRKAKEAILEGDSTKALEKISASEKDTTINAGVNFIKSCYLTKFKSSKEDCKIAFNDYKIAAVSLGKMDTKSKEKIFNELGFSETDIAPSIRIFYSKLFKFYAAENNVDSIKEYLKEYELGDISIRDSAIALRDSLAYDITNKKNTELEYQNFIKEYPVSKYLDDAKSNLCNLAYKKALSLNSQLSYSQFINRFPNSVYKRDVEKKLDDLIWDSVKAINSSDAYKKFINKYPSSGFSAKAKEIFESLVWDSVKAINSSEAYENYINKYPTSSFIKLAKDSVDKILNIQLEQIGLDTLDLFDNRFVISTEYNFWDDELDIDKLYFMENISNGSRDPKLKKTIKRLSPYPYYINDYLNLIPKFWYNNELLCVEPQSIYYNDLEKMYINFFDKLLLQKISIEPKITRRYDVNYNLFNYKNVMHFLIYSEENWKKYIPIYACNFIKNINSEFDFRDKTDSLESVIENIRKVPDSTEKTDYFYHSDSLFVINLPIYEIPVYDFDNQILSFKPSTIIKDRRSSCRQDDSQYRMNSIYNRNDKNSDIYYLCTSGLNGLFPDWAKSKYKNQYLVNFLGDAINLEFNSNQLKQKARYKIKPDEAEKYINKVSNSQNNIIKAKFVAQVHFQIKEVRDDYGLIFTAEIYNISIINPKTN